MNTRRWILLGLVAALLALPLAFAGCTKTDTEDTDSEEEPAEATGLEVAVVAEWAESGHAKLIAFAAVEEECVRCHDGGAFAAGQLTDPAALERDWSVATDCRACHTGYGVEVAASGVVDIPTKEGFEAGVGSLCASCHNGRRVPDPAAERRSAPHHSVQSDVLTGTGGMPLEGVTYLSNDKHANVTNACVACHFDASREGPPSHTFKPYFGSCEADGCHGSAMSAAVEAKADYDGDGAVEAFQDEVQGLSDMLDQAIVDELGGGKYVAASGAITFTDETSQTVVPTNEVYAAAYNKLMVDYDGSLGIHNPAFVVSLLQSTYQNLTGKPSPGVAINSSN